MTTDVFSTPIASAVFKQKYAITPEETWEQCAARVTKAITEDLLPSDVSERIYRLIRDRKFIPGGRYLYYAGREKRFYSNCYLFRAEDTRESWGELGDKTFRTLMSGGGIGVDYSALRPNGAPIGKTGGFSSGPLSLMDAVNEIGRNVMQGGSRRSAIYATLNWDHPDAIKFIRMKDWPQAERDKKLQDLEHRLPMEFTNISISYDETFINAYVAGDEHAHKIWHLNMKQACQTAEPGFSFNMANPRESLRNACTEVVSEDDNDICNIGTLWLNRFDSTDEFAEAVDDATAFLLAGGIKREYPTEEIAEVGQINNRIGLGIGGVHDFLLQRGQPYEVTDDLHDFLEVYEVASNMSAQNWARVLDVNEPKGKRAIAPTGSIGLLAETTTGIEPLFCAAYKRRYLGPDQKWRYQYVIDGTVKRLLGRGTHRELIDANDAYDLGFEQRVRFQADIQDYVDMGISSTCNLPTWGTKGNCEANVNEKARILMQYSKRLRGFTCYPDGARGGQPLTKVPLSEAIDVEGVVFEEREHECTGGVCGV